ncbi:MAG: c-type cytochrome [Rhizomicrobium sp.]|jgi:cytochrome c5
MGSVPRALPFLAGLLIGAAAGMSAAGASALPQHFANADDAKLAGKGQKIYQYSCGSCHGRRMQGQALWQLKDQFAGRRAPALDATGPAWQLSDDDLFALIKYGRTADASRQTTVSMPKFDGMLKDGEIVAVMADIKRGWSIGLRATQAMLNPGFAGMPKNADKQDWTLPPNCIESIQQWQTPQK